MAKKKQEIVLTSQELTNAICDYIVKKNPEYEKKFLGVAFMNDFKIEDIVIKVI